MTHPYPSLEGRILLRSTLRPYKKNMLLLSIWRFDLKVGSELHLIQTYWFSIRWNEVPEWSLRDSSLRSEWQLGVSKILFLRRAFSKRRRPFWKRRREFFKRWRSFEKTSKHLKWNVETFYLKCRSVLESRHAVVRIFPPMKFREELHTGTSL